jgi:hypothetical protein
VLYAQHDQPPAGPSFGQENWAPATPVLGRLALIVPPDMPSGPAELHVLLYEMDSTLEPLDFLLAQLQIDR